MAERTRGYPTPRLRQLSAVPYPDRSSDKMHVYYSPPARRWISVVQKQPGEFELALHNDCPCSG